tara:strand:- start:2533 stop:3318 length:786 start_codon:yes stop_codon:yes gene_type:complete
MVGIEKLTDSYIYNDDTYFADYKYVTNSMLKNTRGGSAHNLEHYINSTFPKSKALLLGSAFHCYLLEPDDFDKRYVWTPKTDRRTTAGKLKYEEYLANSGGREPLEEIYMDIFESMETNIYNHPVVRELLRDSKRETIHFWKDKDSGLECKGKIDIEGKDFLADLKTTSERRGASPWKFDEFRKEWSVDQQGAFYLDGTQKKDFYFIMVELKAPHNVGVYKLSEKSISNGRAMYREQLNYYKQWKEDEVSTFYNNNEALEV